MENVKGARRAALAAGVALAGFSYNAVASAQSAAAASQVEVGATDDATPKSEIVVTATRSGKAINRDLLGSSISVITGQAMEDRQIRIVSDVLRDVPGVAVNRTGAVGNLTQVRIRGAEGNHVLVIIDGIKASDPYQGEYDWGTLLADDAARIEVLRGQQSSLYGSDAIGGVINYITLSGREAPGVRVSAEGGSMGTYQGSARVAGVTGDLDYALSGSAQHTDGYVTAPGGSRDVGAKMAGASGKVNWSPANNFKVTAVGRYSYTHGDTDDFGINPNVPTVSGRAVQGAVDAPGEYYVNRAAYGLVRAELNSFGDLMTTAASAQIADTKRNSYTSAGFDYGDKGQRQRYSLENTLHLGTDAVKHLVTVALDAEREQFRNTTPGSFVDRSRHLVHTYGLVGQYNLTLSDTFGLGASVRHDWNDLFKDNTTWHADASYLFTSGTRLHAAGGSGVKNPGAFELFGYSDGKYIGNPNLRAEKSKGWEVGVDQKFAAGKVRIGATYFDSRLHDEIYTDYPAPAFIATSLNRTTTTHQQGVETFIEASLGDFRADASYTYLHAPQFRSVLATPTAVFSTQVSTQAVRRPKDIASLNVTYAPTALPLTATLTVRYNGKQKDVAYTPSYSAVFADLKAYTLVNFAGTYSVNRHVQLFARIENLLDENYQEVLGYRTPGRAAYGGVKLRF
ncbi:TonB-dependent receptor [Sphingomonas bacterium]|uniref:TonB-dependent receptor n=1 Tax=Sphingomonas bacterium TaxID=1895847 RepID=UPI0015760784|nr:TonB-dependent receptor [Sphingomonas bacterium]